MGGSLFKIPYSSNLRWLIMFYALPRELVEKRPVFLAMPRKVREVVHSEKCWRFTEKIKADGNIRPLSCPVR